jgi:phosphoribosylformylglycinamidine cyclo-ligase
MDGLHGMAHITGGGIEGNLNRVIPDGLNALVDLSRVEIHPVFKLIRQVGNVPVSQPMGALYCAWLTLKKELRKPLNVVGFQSFF